MKNKQIEELENLFTSKRVKSEFLEELYSRPPTQRDEYNLKDIEGRRLSKYWKYQHLLSFNKLILYLEMVIQSFQSVGRRHQT